MKTKVELSEQVLNFVRALAPEPRRSLRLGLRGLEHSARAFYHRQGYAERSAYELLDKMLPDG